MSDTERESRIRRILVALDASPHSLAALEAAADLAERLDAELAGLFVEDVNLLRLADLPFARELSFYGQGSRPLSVRYLERQLRAQATRARRAMERLADEAEIAWSFRVVRGAIAAELLTAADEADLTILGKSGWSLTRRKRQLGSTTRTVVRQSTRLTLVLQRGARLGLPVLVAYDGSSISRRALVAATQFSQTRDGELAVLILADDAAMAQRLQSQVTQWLRERELHAQFIQLTEVNAQTLAQLVEQEACRVLVLPTPSLGLSEEAVRHVLEGLDCPVLLVH